MALPSTAAARDKVREEFGPHFVPARRAAEDDARRILDRSAGAMSREQFGDLGAALRRHQKNGKVRQDRFTPAFRRDRIEAMIERLDDLNEAIGVIWGSSNAQALARVDTLLPDALPWAVPCLPTALMYLRDPERFGIEIWSTMNGLGVAYGHRHHYPDRDGNEYTQFCDDLQSWREEWDVLPQEHDAVLNRLFVDWRKLTGRKHLLRPER